MTRSWLLAGFALLSAVQGLNYYVSPQGSDSNSGTIASPFLTLTKAQAAVRIAVATKPAEAITVNIADGVYILNTTLLLTAEDSGTSGYPVVWKALGSNALISGGLKLTGWTLNSTTGIYSTTVPVGTQSRNLYVGGSAAQYARAFLDKSKFGFTNTSITWTDSAYDWLATLPGIGNAEIRSMNSFTDRRLGYGIIWDTMHFLILGGILEAIVAVGGTYDAPAHDVTFQGLNFAHTTWNLVTTQGYCDQQTGGFLRNFNLTYPIFEASRPYWDQMPSGIQISAAYNIAFTGGKYTQLGAGGFGIGNDPFSHVTGIGYGAENISVLDGYFTQVMGNSLTLGGIQANGHHPTDPRMINSRITVSGNIFYNTSALFSSTVPIFSTYIQYSTISNNDLSHIPYSGICHGYGWGANDQGGSPEYATRGLYNYQPLYTTPTTSLSNVVSGNLIHHFGLAHQDLGGIYTLSKSPSTIIRDNYDYSSTWFGLYTDEGSNSLTILDNMFFPAPARWFNPNQRTGLNTGNNTLKNNFAAVGSDYVNTPNGTGQFGNTFESNYVVRDAVTNAAVTGQRTAYRAGVLPGRRAGRPVSNPALADAYTYIAVIFPSNIATDLIRVNITNFDDVPLTAVSFQTSISSNYALTPVSVPQSIPANSFAIATWKITGNTCTAPVFAVNVTYTNSRLSKQGSLRSNTTLPGIVTGATTQGWTTSSSWPALFGATCHTVGISTSGRDLWKPYDDWGAIYTPALISTSGHFSVYVNSQDSIGDPWTRSGVVVRNSLASNTRSTGYATLLVTAGQGVVFSWDSSGDGITDSMTTVPGIRAPLFLKLTVNGSAVVGAYSYDEVNWKQAGNATLYARAATLDAGMIHTSHTAFTNSTAIFSRFNPSNA
ncbi:pectin lyase fold/virulence factor [Hyaloscypha sp. PMI_1271]|nr:pectin lyase fold/virulence factor [Hyaloscypha sp. PMI_1271]